MKAILYILLGMISAVAIAGLVVAIGCAINGLGFSEQITEWFSNTAPAVETVKAVVKLPIA